MPDGDALGKVWSLLSRPWERDSFLPDIGVDVLRLNGSDFEAYITPVSEFPVKRFYLRMHAFIPGDDGSVHCLPFEKWLNLDEPTAAIKPSVVPDDLLRSANPVPGPQNCAKHWVALLSRERVFWRFHARLARSVNVPRAFDCLGFYLAYCKRSFIFLIGWAVAASVLLLLSAVVVTLRIVGQFA